MNKQTWRENINLFLILYKLLLLSLFSPILFSPSAIFNFRTLSLFLLSVLSTPNDRPFQNNLRYVICFKKILIKHIYLCERVKLQWQKLVFNGDLEIIVIQNGLCVFLVRGEKIESKQSSLTLFKLTPSQGFHSCLGELGVDIESLASGIVVGIAYTHTLSLYHTQTHTFWANTWCDYNKINCVYKFGLFHFLLQLRAFNFWNLLIISSSRNIKK